MPVRVYRGVRSRRDRQPNQSATAGSVWSTRLAATLGVVAAASLVSGAAAQQTRPIQPDDYYRIEQIGGSQLSPDGRYLLYTVRTVRQAENDRITHIWFTDLETGRSRRLSTAGVNSTNPNWTPDGRRVYFTTTRGDESGLHFIDFLEPGGEAYQIEGIPSSPNFAPDGSWILVQGRLGANGQFIPTGGGGRGGRGGGGPVDPDETPGGAACWPAGSPALTGPTDPTTRGKSEAERNCDVYVITHSGYKRDGTYSFLPPGRGGRGGGGRGARGGGAGGGADPQPTQFFRIPADGLAAGEQPRQITTDDANKSFQSFSPDGAWILYTVTLEQGGRGGRGGGGDDDDARMPEVGIYRVSVDGGESDEIVRVRGQIGDVTIAPDNRRLVFTLTEARRTDEFLRVVDVRSGETVADIGRGWKFPIGDLRWSPNSREIRWVSGIGVTDQVVKAPATGGEITRVTDGLHTLSGVSYDRSGRRMAYVKASANRPGEVYVANADGSRERQVTHVNDDFLKEVRLSRFERFTFDGVPHNREWLDQLKEKGVRYMLENNAPDGERPEIEALLIYPLDYQEGRRYPMVTFIHGGPHGRYSAGFNHEFQMVAAQGIFVLYTNPRGSTNYGTGFQYMTRNAWGIDDAKDILGATDLVVERGLADPQRLGVSGGSYGGFMTNWLTSQDQRWKAAVTDRSISNWISFYGVSDASSLVEGEFDGMPWPYMHADSGSYMLATMLSPIVWADKVTTPTLIIHSINDYRTPLEGGEQWYRALQKNDVPVKMVLFPDSSHGLAGGGEPWLSVRRLKEYVDWFRAYLVEDNPVISTSGGA